MTRKISTAGRARQACAGSWKEHEADRRAALRRDAQREMGVNLSEGIALSRFLSGFVGSARKQ
jgi:hypothetical protein